MGTFEMFTLSGQCSDRLQAETQMLCLMFGVASVALKAVRESDKRQRSTLPLSHDVQSRPSCVLNSVSEESLGAAGSTPSPRLGQRFMSKGLSVEPLLRFSLLVRALPRTFTETVSQSRNNR